MTNETGLPEEPQGQAEKEEKGKAGRVQERVGNAARAAKEKFATTESGRRLSLVGEELSHAREEIRTALGKDRELLYSVGERFWRQIVDAVIDALRHRAEISTVGSVNGLARRLWSLTGSSVESMSAEERARLRLLKARLRERLLELRTAESRQLWMERLRTLSGSRWVRYGVGVASFLLIVRGLRRI